MTPDELQSLTRNPFFLARVYGPVRGVDVEDALGVTDEAFDELDELCETDDDDDGVVTSTVAVPIFLAGGYQWTVEYYDNGEDAGVTHTLRAADAEPITIATIDAHASGQRLRWADAMTIIAAARTDARNAPVADALPLLLRAVTALDASDDAATVRDTLAAAWIAVGATREAAATIAKASVPTKRASATDDDDDDDDDAAARDCLAQLLAELR